MNINASFNNQNQSQFYTDRLNQQRGEGWHCSSESSHTQSGTGPQATQLDTIETNCTRELPGTYNPFTLLFRAAGLPSDALRNLFPTEENVKLEVAPEPGRPGRVHQHQGILYNSQARFLDSMRHQPGE